jgi:superfamily II DNA or RNA helicase
MSYILRPHQEKNREELSDEFTRHRAVLLVAECGYGKGCITADIIERVSAKGKYVLFLVYGKDRVGDMHDRVTRLGIPHGVLMGGVGRERWHKVQVASSSTVFRMEHKPRADLVVVDETHLSMSPTFRAVLDCYPDSRILGLTATPVFGNNRPLGKASGGIYESMVKGPGVNQLIREGYLVGSRVFAPDPPEGMRRIKKKKNGEFDENEGAAIADKPKVIGDVVEHYRKHGAGRKAAIFGFHQKHAFDIAEAFRAAGFNWAYVDASTPEGDICTPGTRKFIWHQYDHGDLLGISNCNVASVGWDHSVCKYLGFASKTSSFQLFRQRLGRGSRPHKGFDDFVVVDHCGGLWEFPEEHRYFESEIDWQLDRELKRYARDVDDEAALSVRRCPKCYFTFRSGASRVCPSCGFEIPLKLRKIEEEDGDLPEVKKTITAPPAQKKPVKAYSENEKWALFKELRDAARLGSRSENWISITFSRTVGHFPPKHWWMPNPREQKEILNAMDRGEY